MTQEDEHRIKKFIDIAEKVKTSTFRREAKTIRFELNFQAGVGAETKISGYDEDAFRSMLMDLRKLTLKQDGVRIEEVCDLIIRNTTDPDTLKNVSDCKAIYLDLMTNPQVKMIINGAPEKGSDIVRKWLYSHYIHEPVDENENELTKLGPALPTHKYNFIITITSLIDLSAVIANNAKILLGL